MCWGANDAGQSALVGKFSVLALGSEVTCGVNGANNNNVVCVGSLQNGMGNFPAPGATPYVAICANGWNACVLGADGVATCWGNENWVASKQRLLQIACGTSHGCGITADGTNDIVCWGPTNDGRMTGAQGAPFSDLAVGYEHSCGIVQGTRAPACFGHAANGNIALPVDAFAGVTVISIASGGHQLCAVTGTGGTPSGCACVGIVNVISGEATPPTGVVFAKLAGSTTTTCGITEAATLQCWGSNPGGLLSPPAGTYSGIACGIDFCIAISSSNSRIFGWGSNSGGAQTVPGGTTTYSRVAAGDFHACAIKLSNKAPVCWGLNDNLQTVLPVPLPSCLEIAAGNRATCCTLFGAKTITCWGALDERLLSAPAGAFVAIAASRAGGAGRAHGHMCAVRDDGAGNTVGGTLACWGSNNDYGQQDTAAGGRFVGVACGDDHTCGVTAAGTVVCFGRTPLVPAVTVPAGCALGSAGLSAAACVACVAGSFASAVGLPRCALCGSGMYASGSGAVLCTLCAPGTANGAVGRASACAACAVGQFSSGGTATCTPCAAGTFAASTGSSVCVVCNGGTTSAAGASSCASCPNGVCAPGRAFAPQRLHLGQSYSACSVSAAGRAVCAGYNSHGQTDAPVRSDFLEVGIGTQHACGRVQSGRFVCWGYNGDTRARPPATLFSKLTVGLDFNCGIVAADSSLLCFGRNDYGQLNVPSSVAAVSDASAGHATVCAVIAGGYVKCWVRCARDLVWPSSCRECAC